jgi:hypothetical protein
MVLRTYIEIVNGKTDTIIKDDTYDRFELNKYHRVVEKESHYTI